jgi:hypothetical protein
MLPESLFAALADFRFAGDVFAAQEGAPVVTGEPILEVTAPIGQAQVVETLVVNQISLQTVLASKGGSRRRGRGGASGRRFRREAGAGARRGDQRGARFRNRRRVGNVSPRRGGALSDPRHKNDGVQLRAGVRRRARGVCGLRRDLPEHGPAGRYLRHARRGAPRDQTSAPARRRLPAERSWPRTAEDRRERRAQRDAGRIAGESRRADRRLRRRDRDERLGRRARTRLQAD